MGFVFFMLLINSFSGGDFLDGVPAGLLGLGQAPLLWKRRIFSECNSFRSFFFRKLTV